MYNIPFGDFQEPSNMILVDHNGVPVHWQGYDPQRSVSMPPLPTGMMVVSEQVIPLDPPDTKPEEMLGKVVKELTKKPKSKPVKMQVKAEENPDLQCLFDCMVSMCAWLNELRTQSHLIHLNYTGSEFLSIHNYLKTRYETHQEQFDLVGELLRSMGGKMPMCSMGLQEAICGCFENCTSYSGVDMLMSYVKNLEEMGMRAKDLEQLAACNRAIDVQDYACQLVADAFKASWFIKASCC